MKYIDIVLLFLVGVLIGYIYAHRRLEHRAIGSIRVDRSDPNEPYLFLELSESLENIIKSNYVTLKVEAKDYISRK